MEDGGLMTIDGNDSTIHHNCTGGHSGNYGLDSESSSSIHIKSLTIQSISTNNGGGGNYCTGSGYGTIAIVDNEGTIIETIQEGKPKTEESGETWGDIWGL